MKQKKTTFKGNPVLAQQYGYQKGYSAGMQNGYDVGVDAYCRLSIFAFEQVRDSFRDSTGKRYLSEEVGAAFFGMYIEQLNDMVKNAWGKAVNNQAKSIMEVSKDAVNNGEAVHQITEDEAHHLAASDINAKTEVEFERLNKKYVDAANRWKAKQK